MSLEQVLADWREEAGVLRKHGHGREADAILRFAGQVAVAAEEYLRWLSEAEAMTRSGRSRSWLRSHFPEWEAQGHARRGKSRIREYRMLIIPQRVHRSAAYEQGRQAGKDAA